MITIYTDGSSRGNPGPGGWGAIVIFDDKTNSSKVIEIGGHEKQTTNNRMELTATIEALKRTPTDSNVIIHSDSKYLIDGISKWIHGWKKNGWRTKDRKSVLNQDLWVMLDKLVSERQVQWKHVSGHSGIVSNERCDEIATAFADGLKIELFDGGLGGYIYI